MQVGQTIALRGLSALAEARQPHFPVQVNTSLEVRAPIPYHVIDGH